MEADQHEAMSEAKSFFSYGRKLRRARLLVFHVPVGFVFGISAYLFFTDKPIWLSFAIGVVGLLCFGIARVATESHFLAAFTCPECRTPIRAWERNPEYRVFYNCPHCRTRWDIGYVFSMGPE